MNRSTPRARAERLITLIRDRAFDELQRRRGELQPMALTIDDENRIGLVAVYTGDEFPDPDNHLVDLRSTLRAQAQRLPLAGAATAHRERLTLPGSDECFETVCVNYESRSGRPVRVYFPYRIRKKLSGPSEVTPFAPVTLAGTHAVFPPPAS